MLQDSVLQHYIISSYEKYPFPACWSRLITAMSQNRAISPNLSGVAAWVLKYSPFTWLNSWLLYLGIQTHVGSTMQPEMKPLQNICEYLHALHIYTDEARRGEVRTVCGGGICEMFCY
jgi:hypothetical protein